MFDNPSKSALFIVFLIVMMVTQYQCYFWMVEKQLNMHGLSLEDRPQTTHPRFPGRTPREEKINAVHNHLIAKYDISLTTKEIVDYMKTREELALTGDQFQAIQENVRNQIAAAEAVVAGRMTAKEAAEKYLAEDGASEVYMPMLEGMTASRLQEMKRMFPTSLDDAYAKSVSGFRFYAEAERIIDHLKQEEVDIEIGDRWKNEYEFILLEYADAAQFSL